MTAYKSIFAAVAVSSFIAISSPVAANCYASNIGSIEYYHCDDGSSGTATDMGGGITVYNNSDGTSRNGTRNDGAVYHDYSNGTTDRATDSMIGTDIYSNESKPNH